MRKRTLSPAQAAWRRSAEWRRIASEHCKAMNAARAAGPKCGAHSKKTGEPCRRPPMANGRCRVHGGRTPKGKEWHRPAWPDRNDPRAVERAEAKLRDRERAANKRAARLAAMTPEEKARHDAWQRAHKPGSAAERARLRADRQAAVDVRKRLAGLDGASRHVSDEVRQLEELITELKAEIRAHEGETNEDSVWKGVFA